MEILAGRRPPVSLVLVPGPIAMQVEYSLVARDVESEHIPAAREAGTGVVLWSPLAGGFPSGKCDRKSKGDRGRLSGPNPFGNSKFVERNRGILDVLKAIVPDASASFAIENHGPRRTTVANAGRLMGRNTFQ